ncbi:MAG: hypothetical protein Q9174_004522, partial [Haloplaca sp. 1 TL-2023]
DGNPQAYDQQRNHPPPGANTVRIWTPDSHHPSLEYQHSLDPAPQSSLHHSTFNPSDYTTYQPTALETSFDSTTAFADPQNSETTGLPRATTMSGDYAATPAAGSSAIQYYNASGGNGMELASQDPSLDDINLSSITWPGDDDPDFLSYS